MTRINVIPVCELSDQHLIAEYRELPRVLKQTINVKDAPKEYHLGKGHVKWAKCHELFLVKRQMDIIREMRFRNFHVSYGQLFDLSRFDGDYIPTIDAIKVNRDRIKEKIGKKPNWYKWTKRNKPEWVK